MRIDVALYSSSNGPAQPCPWRCWAALVHYLARNLLGQMIWSGREVSPFIVFRFHLAHILFRYSIFPLISSWSPFEIFEADSTNQQSCHGAGQRNPVHSDCGKFDQNNSGACGEFHLRWIIPPLHFRRKVFELITYKNLKIEKTFLVSLTFVRLAAYHGKADKLTQKPVQSTNLWPIQFLTEVETQKFLIHQVSGRYFAIWGLGSACSVKLKRSVQWLIPK